MNLECEWLAFEPEPETHTLYIDIGVGRFLELLPSDPDEVDEFCQEFYPILDQIQALCVQHNLEEVCTMDVSEVSLRGLKPTPIMRFLWNVDEYSQKPGLLKGCQIYGGGSVFNALLKTFKSLLPTALSSVIEVVDWESDDDT